MFNHRLLALSTIFTLCINTMAFATVTSSGVTFDEITFDIGARAIEAKIATIDLSNPEITFTAENIGGIIGQTNELNKIVTEKNPIAVLNTGLEDKNNPRGNFYVEGEFIFTSSGMTSMGITESGGVIFGKPMIFSRVVTTDNTDKRALSWTMRDINSNDQTGEQSVIYTSSYGNAVNITNAGWVASIEDTVIKSFFRVESGRQAIIPQNGYLLYFSDKFANTTYFMSPEIGRSISVQHTSMKLDNEEFPIENLVYIISGDRRLVKGSTLNKEVPFTNSASGDSHVVTSRTAVGRLADGRLVFAFTPGANLDELGEIMVRAGCTDAISLNSGENCTMYVNGNYITLPTSQIPTAILIELDEQN